MDSSFTYLLSSDRIDFCSKRLKSYKISRIISPLAYLIINYAFIFALLGFGNYYRALIIYIVLCVVMTVAIYFITTSAIKRYSNIVTKIIIQDKAIFEITSLIGNNHTLKKDEYTIAVGTLSENRNNKFKTLVITSGGNNFTIIPEWFENYQEVLTNYFTQ